jgi:hypothetical protein
MIRSRSSIRSGRVARTLLAGVTLAVAALLASAEGAAAQHKAQLKDARLIIEYNSTALDAGVQLFLDADGWSAMKIFDPRGRLLFHGFATGSLLAQGGGTELFLESEEPPLSEEPIDVLFGRFPEGVYRFQGRTTEGAKLAGEVEFSHDIPAGPHVVAPAQGSHCPQVAGPVVIDWDAVDTTIEGEPIEIEAYEVIVENEGNLDVILPAAAGTQLTVPSELLDPATEYKFEVLAVADNGNQTITEGCFVTN